MGKSKKLNLQEIQQGSFQILLKIKEIFDDNKWRYYLSYGTLIGAIRHDGFIPWDDDIDIWVPRPDYEKFVDYCISHKEELKPFELMHYKTNNKYIYPIARLSDSRYENHYTNAKEYGLGLFVDIYPLDGCVDKDKLNYYKIRYLYKMIGLCGSSQLIKRKNKFETFLKRILYTLFKYRKINKLLKKIDILSQKYPYETSKYVSCVCWRSVKWEVSKSLIEGDLIKKHVFNGVEFNIPIEYDKILTQFYGNYMDLPSEEDRIAHHFYTVTRKQDEKENLDD